VMGKLAANSLRSFYGLLAAVPVVCCAWVLGGVTVPEISRVVLALLNIFFFAHAAGLLVSTFSRDAHRATAGTAALLLFYFLGISGLVAALQYKNFPAAASILEVFDPGNAFRQSSAGGTPVGSYWISLLAVHLNAWLFLALASLRMPGCWQDKPRDINSTWRARFRQWCFGPPDARQALRRRLLDINPFLWLVSRSRLGPIVVWGGLGLMGCAFAWGLGKVGLRESMPLFIVAVVISHSLLKFWIASETCHHLEDQRRSGALEFLLSCTPLRVSEIIRGQWLALRRRFLGPVLALLNFDLLLILASQMPAAQNGDESKARFAVAVGASMQMLVTDAFAIGWVGMWRAMSAKKPRQAAGQTISRILVLPWLLMGLMGAMRFLTSFWATLIIWFGLGIAVDIAFALWAQRNLYSQFRALAAVQPEESLGIPGQLGRMLGKMAGG